MRSSVVAYVWASPVSLAGLAGALLARAGGGTVAVRDGVVEATGGGLQWLLPRLGVGVAPVAMAMGHVILAVDDETLCRLRAHELVHVRQAERWGIFFPVAYVAASAVAVLRGRHPYRDNAFEREASAADH